MEMNLRPIGYVRSELKTRAESPKQGYEGAPEAVIIVEPDFTDALHGIEVGQEILLITWLHESDRSYLQVHPRGNPQNPLQGVFNTRSPDRPNPLGLHPVRVVELIDRLGLRVEPLEALDGTPVVDIKPQMRSDTPAQETQRQEVRDWGQGIPTDAAESLRELGIKAAEQGLFCGINGNLSLRLGTSVLITCRGSRKSDLTPGDLTLLDLEGGKRLTEGRPSSEAPMHLSVYDRQNSAWVVMHTHPPYLLALSLRLRESSLEALLGKELFEAARLVSKTSAVGEHQPGSQALAEAVAIAAGESRIIFLPRHGLLVWGKSPDEVLTLTEECESLARIRLLALRTGEDTRARGGSPAETEVGSA